MIHPANIKQGAIDLKFRAYKSLKKNITVENAKGLAKMAPETAAAFVLGHYSYIGTANLLDKTWKDKSDAAVFVKNLTAAEVSNLSATIGSYAGRGALNVGLNVGRGTIRAGSAGIAARSFAAASRTAQTSAMESASMMSKLMTKGNVYSIGGEFFLNAGKGGLAIGASLIAGEATKQSLIAMGAKSHVLIEGGSAIAEEAAGLGVMLAFGLISGPVGWAMVFGQTAMTLKTIADAQRKDMEEARYKKLAGLQQKAIESRYEAIERQNLDALRARTLFLKYYQQTNYDAEAAIALVKKDPEFTRDIERASAWSGTSTQMEWETFESVLEEHFTTAGIAKNSKETLGTIPETTDPTQIEINRLYSKAFANKYAIETKATEIPEALTQDEINYLNTNQKNWDVALNLEVQLGAASTAYTIKEVQKAQTEMLRAWDEEGKFENDINADIYDIAAMDPNWLEFYNASVTADAQRQVLQAFNDSSLTLDALPPNLVRIALSDGKFGQIYTDYTRKMAEMSEFYGMSIQDLAKQGSLTEEQITELHANLKAEQEAEVAKINAENQVLVDKYNAELATQISSYGSDLPDIIANINLNLMLSGRSAYVGMSEKELYDFLKMNVPEVTFEMPDPGPDFIYDPNKEITITPTGEYISNQQKKIDKYILDELEIRLSLMEDPEEVDRERILNALKSDKPYDEALFPPEKDAFDRHRAEHLGIPFEELRQEQLDYYNVDEAEVERRLNEKYKPEERESIARMIEAKKVKPDVPVPVKQEKPVPKEYTDEEIENLYDNEIQQRITSKVDRKGAIEEVKAYLRNNEQEEIDYNWGLYLSSQQATGTGETPEPTPDTPTILPAIPEEQYHGQPGETIQRVDI
jgi:hypothetical protein